MKYKKYNSEKDQKFQEALTESRRNFLTKASLMLAASGLNLLDAQDILNKKWSKLFPHAYAANTPSRLLEICLRSGVPNTIFQAGSDLASLAQPTYSNFSYAGNDVRPSSLSINRSYFNVDSAALLPFADYVANTQSLQVDGGHTNVFSVRHGMNKAPAIVELANQNRTGSLLGGAQWSGNNLVKNSNLGMMADLAAVDDAGFKALFKKPALTMSASEVELVTKASQKLSRRQAMLLDHKLQGALVHAGSQGKVAELLNTDFSTMLNTNDFDSALKPAGLAAAGESLGLALKGMSLNLVNSGMVGIQLGDLHGFQQDKQLATVTRSLSGILASLINYMQKTDDPSASGLKLWDTTTIAISSEFTRGIAKFNQDNSDGGSNGIMYIGKKVRGGFYGSIDTSVANNAQAKGFDPATGATAMSMSVLPSSFGSETTRALVGLEVSALGNTFMKCMVRG